MAQPYVGEIRMFAGNFAPVGWAFCDGQLLSIAENDVLFTLIGTTYGGDGQSTFALPDLRGRAPVHMGQGAGLSSYSLGQGGGAETATLTSAQLPQHAHVAQAQAEQGSRQSPQGSVWAGSNLSHYSSNSANAQMNSQSLAPAGGSQSHDNMVPFQCVSFIISLFGIFPSPT